MAGRLSGSPVDHFVGDELVDAEKKVLLKDMMTNSVKEIQTLSSQA